MEQFNLKEFNKSIMVSECIYRGFCPEFLSPCGYSKTDKFKEDLKKYREE